MGANFTTSVNMTKTAEPEDLGIYVNMLVDGNFKLIMANPANKGILISLLNELIPKKITDLKLVMQEKQGRRLDLKNSIFDLDCELDDGSTAVVEVQFNTRADYMDRMLYYSTWPITEQKLVSENNYKLKDVYLISFCNFALRHDNDWDEDKVVSSYTLREDSNSEKMTDALHFVYVELGRFKKEQKDLKSQLESFLFYLKNMSYLKEIPSDISYEPVNNMVQIAAVESLSPDDRDLYDRTLRNAFDIRTEKIYAREEGLAEGRAEGRAKGLAEGRAEEKAEIAKAFLAKGVDVATIAECTGLSEDEIKAL